MAEHLMVPRTVFVNNQFSWVFLIWYLAYGFLTLLFLFYFNRIIAALVSYFIRLYTWHNHRVHVELQSLQISLLAGRIFFRGVKYFGRNETILIHDGHITWRYWLLRVRELPWDLGGAGTQGDTNEKEAAHRATEGSDEHQEGGKSTASRGDLPCRILVKVRGVQWFIYNRSPAYDSIMKSMLDTEDAQWNDHSTTSGFQGTAKEVSVPHDSLRERHRQRADTNDENEKSLDASIPMRSTSPTSTVDTIDTESSSSKPAIPNFVNIFPIEIDCGKAAVVVGNKSTKSVLVAKIDAARGQFTARSSGPQDIYQQVIDFDFDHPTVQFKPNRDYVGSMFQEGENLCSDTAPKARESWYRRLSTGLGIDHASAFLKELAPTHWTSTGDVRRSRVKQSAGEDAPLSSRTNHANRWLGLTRYLDEDDETWEQERWRGIDYAQVPVVVDCPSVSMSFYWDVPGLVTSNDQSAGRECTEHDDGANIPSPPVWAIELRIKGGSVNYGPWADKQRADLQNVFFPPLYKDIVPNVPPPRGSPRLNTALKVFIIVEESVKMHIPHREESKDWRWKGRGNNSQSGQSKGRKGPHFRMKKASKSAQELESRPYGWIDAQVQRDSTVSFVIDMVAGPQGYGNKVNVDLKEVELSSSVNHATFLKSRSQIISCDLSNPLSWNALRHWHIDFRDDGMELFILRDHMFLLTDLINDWSSGPPSAYHTFVPFQYSLGLNFHDIQLFLNANEFNIIDDPTNLESNHFVVLFAQSLSAKLSIPMKFFRPSKNAVHFNAKAHDGGLKTYTPPWNTQQTFLPCKQLACLRDLDLNGSYNYYTSTSPSLTDVLLLDIFGSNVKVQLYGFLIKFLITIKENYFGDDVHFRTTEEHQSILEKEKGGSLNASPTAFSEHHKPPGNDLDTILTINAEKCTALLPANLYSAGAGPKIEIFSAMADLRLTNYYMDLAASFSPIGVLAWKGPSTPEGLSEGSSEMQLFLEGLQVKGHRLFGLPPDEPTYMCNWDFGLGKVSGECSVDFLKMALPAVRCFTMSIDDKENALTQLARPEIHDVTFLSARVQEVAIALRLDECALILRTGDISVSFDDLADLLFSTRLCAAVPRLYVAITDASLPESMSPSRTYAYITATINIDFVVRKRNMQHLIQVQQEHIALHDIRTNRTPWLVLPEYRARIPVQSVMHRLRPPGMTYPQVADPTGLTRIKAGNADPGLMVGERDSQNDRNSKSTRPSSAASPQFVQRWGGRDDRAGDANESPHTSQDHRPRSFMQNRQHSSTAGSSFGFSSPFKTPHFPLLAIDPDESGVPHPPPDMPADDEAEETEALNDLRSRLPIHDDVDHSSLMIGLKNGVQGMIEPKALELLTSLQRQMAPADPIALLDALQIHVLEDILGVEKKRQKGSKSLEVRMYVPHLVMRMANASQNALRRSAEEHEHYEFVMRNATTIMRFISVVPVDETKPMSSQIAMHLLAERLALTARESSIHTPDQAVINLQVQDCLFWVVKGATTSCELQITDCDVTSASRKVNYVSSLIHHTALLAENVADRITSTMKQQKNRLRMFMLLLTQDEGFDREPPFLSSASYIVRTAKNHLRTSHSWWMLSHLRYALMNMPKESQRHLWERTSKNPGRCPDDAAQTMAGCFERLRTWDLGHASSTLLMHRVYGKKATRNAKEQLSLNASINVRRLRLLIEPGARENEVLMEGILLGISTGHPQSFGSSTKHDEINTVSAYAAKLAVRFNWSLCELIENIVETARDTQWYGIRNEDDAPTEATKHPTSLHLIAVIDYGVINIAAISAQAVTVFKELRLSIKNSITKSSHQHDSLSILLDVVGTRTEAFHQTKTIFVYNLRHPQVFASRDIRQQTQGSGIWKVVCSGERAVTQLKQPPLDISEIIDEVIQNEVSQLMVWSGRLVSKGFSSANAVAQKPSKRPGLQVAVVLKSYSITTMILPRLVYEIYGHGLRLSVQSGISGDTITMATFELKAHTHTFRSDLDDRSTEISTLNIPPINVLVNFDLAQSFAKLKVRAMIEHIQLDATSLHAMLDAINQPAIITLGQSLKHEIDLIQHHLDVIFEAERSSKSKSSQASSSKFIFDAEASVQKLTVRAATPEAPSVGRAAILTFEVGRIFMIANNVDQDTGGSAAFPNFNLRIDSIRLALVQRDKLGVRNCGRATTSLNFKGHSKLNENGKPVRAFDVKSLALHIDLYTETASALVAIVAHLKETLKTIEIPHELKDLSRLGRKRLQREGILPKALQESPETSDFSHLAAMFSLILADIRITWKIGDTVTISPLREPEDLVLSFRKIDLATKSVNAARLLVQDFQLQMAPASKHVTRSPNSALLPEVVFNVAYKMKQRDLHLVFQAVGKTFDLQLTSQSILPANDLKKSIATAIDQVRAASARWMSERGSDVQKPSLLSNKRLASLYVYADFAGAIVQVQGRSVVDPQTTAVSLLRNARRPQQGKYNQFVSDQSTSSGATLRSPGIAVKVEYKNNHEGDESLNAEMMVSGSSNTLYPTVVPLVVEISSSIKETMRDLDGQASGTTEAGIKSIQPRFLEDNQLRSGDPTSVLGNCKLNLGLRICQQDFSLSCQPIARVAARARFEDIYFTVNTVQSEQHGKFYTLTAAFTGLETSVQHVYSRESSGSVKIQSIVVSLMNSKHLTDISGISAIVKLSPVQAQVNAKQLQDFLLFREIWIPPDIRQTSDDHAPATPTSEAPNFVIQRYQQLAAASAFPWNATLSIEEIKLQLDLGASIGKTQLVVSNLWVSSQKSSDWEQNLCIALDGITADSSGRMSGLVHLTNLKIRTTIKWLAEEARTQTPLVQASVTLSQLKVKAGFDFQAFFIADISSFDFLMYNVRNKDGEHLDRLVSVLEGQKVHAFCTTTTAAQTYALVQAFQRLIEEKRKAYETSLADIEKFLRRKSTARPDTLRVSSAISLPKTEKPTSLLRLQTDVVVSLQEVKIGAFPRTFVDHQIFKLEALDTSARFAVYVKEEKIHSALSMALGQLRVALSSVDYGADPKTLGDLAIDDMIAAATLSRGGTILKVPRLVATMETWQEFESTHIDYIFKSEFQGRVDVGWNYSRISYIRGMYANHARTLAQRLGKPLPQAAVQITGLEDEGGDKPRDTGQEKITAVVNVPQSKYQYTALQPPMIETPQLRDMGEATPPLEWIGLHRERLPTLTHQVVIVTLLEVAKEVDDAYSKILGSS